MIKKHLISCSILFAGTLTGTVLFTNSNSVTESRKAARNRFVVPNEDSKPETQNELLTFANESLPVGDLKVAYRMKRALKAHDFERLGTNKLHRKAAIWFPIIEPILASYGIPEDFKYITLVESGLKSGTSPKGASGYWQFMPGTARSFGLKVNSSVDERQNMRKSTVAACKYLKEMYGELKSWTLVAAAYNLGDVKLRSQMTRQKQNNYFKMKLNKETAGYVYKLISMKEIIENPARYGYERKPVLLASQADIHDQNRVFNHNPTTVLNTLQN